jgi:hypothetical protein
LSNLKLSTLPDAEDFSWLIAFGDRAMGMPSANMPTTVKTNATLRLAIPAHVRFLASRKIASVNRTTRNENKEKPSVQIVMTATIYVEMCLIPRHAT